MFSSMHCFEGPEWLHLKRGRESFARGPLVKVDPQGRCAGVIVYGLQMIVLKAAEVFLSLCITTSLWPCLCFEFRLISV